MRPFSVESRVWKSLRRLTRFSLASEGVPETVRARWALTAREGEDLLGFYRNGETEEMVDSLVLVSDLALYTLEPRKEIQTIEFSEIRDLSGPREKRAADQIQLTLNDSSAEILEIRGGDEKIRDVFAFVRFLSWVVLDRERSKQVG